MISNYKLNCALKNYSFKISGDKLGPRPGVRGLNPGPGSNFSHEIKLILCCAFPGCQW